MEGFASGADPDKELLHASQTAADLEGKFMSVTEVLPVSINTLSVLLRFYFLFSQRLLLGDFKSQLAAYARMSTCLISKAMWPI